MPYQNQLLSNTRFLWPRLCLLALVLAAAPCSRAQVIPVPPASQGGPGSSRTSLTPDPDPLAARSAARLDHMRQDERYKRLQADTVRLVALTNELKDEVDKASKDQLSVTVVRKAAEIEKLAKDVKDRMRY